MKPEFAAFGVAVALLGFFVASNLTGLVVYDLIPQHEALAALSTDDYYHVTVDPLLFSVNLRAGCQQLQVVTDEIQTQSIRRGIQDVRDFRPNTHDLIDDILETFEMETLMVKIENVAQDTYYAKLLIQQENRILNLDAKPSDAIAVAVRTGAPVYVHQDVMEQYGQRVC